MSTRLQLVKFLPEEFFITENDPEKLHELDTMIAKGKRRLGSLREAQLPPMR